MSEGTLFRKGEREESDEKGEGKTGRAWGFLAKIKGCEKKMKEKVESIMSKPR